MSLNQLHKQLREKNIKYLFTDYYDTVVHRHVHPNYVQRIWAKLMIRELGLSITIDELYFIRQESSKYLVSKLNKTTDEIPYPILKGEVANRLINANVISYNEKEDFINLFEAIDVRAESDIQYLNQEVLNTLKNFKSNGGKVYLISDFYGSKTLFEKLLTHHGILDVFDGIYSSAELKKSKHHGTVYNQIVSELSIDSKTAMMIGDNLRSDYTNAIKNGLNAYHLPHKKYLNKNKRNNFGNDKKQLERIINNVYKACQKNTSIPYTEFIIQYHTFVERLYETAKRQGIKDLVFLSREGQYLKKLFDSYQNFALINEGRRIKTHYLKISRHAALQMSLKAIEEEPFTFLRLKYSNLAVDDFLLALNCSDELRAQIISELKIDAHTKIEDFFNSSVFETLKRNDNLKNYYEKHRKESHNAFKAYVDSLNLNIEANGINLVDIGWGGTMQEAIYEFFEQQIPVTGYYLGLGNIYNIQPKTKRYGLISSIMPYTGYYDHILMANQQLYEQFSGADHGSAFDYNLKTDGYVIEHHKPEEKWLYDNHIKAHQEQMFALHISLLKSLAPICYSEDTMQAAISKTALKSGLFQGTKKLKFLNTLSHGFYQNVGHNKVGISYEPPKIVNPVKMGIQFLLTPEKFFRYLVKLKPMLYKKNKIVAFFAPMYLIYLYFGINKYLRFKVLKHFFLLKYNVFNNDMKHGL
ncbi:HAD family hydrolase [Winogradskyella bathintestinalis]|uniref:phosphoglycolate phosphatase n=1 Tax=Winogradskyella bathintestinalis TaxID=3035208 RepID=A0ABT7ZR55_9FLAO|nr:HAD family hydrolase [Winogradskyella bathintestinalis]MDN3491480.1 HAD family hydrolase [Winogradskyella bathintestinalis]